MPGATCLGYFLVGPPAPDMLTEDIWEQASPFLLDNTSQVPARLVRPSDFDKYWKAIPDDSGLYVDDCGRKVAVKRRCDGESLSETKDVHWAAYNAARVALLAFFWDCDQNSAQQIGDQVRLTIMWQRRVQATLDEYQKEVRNFILHEVEQMASVDTRTTVVGPLNLYQYPALPLDSSAIRLVLLLPSPERHYDIICRLCSTTLDRSDSDKYEALSYVWGDPSKKKAITVDNKSFPATENLESALRNLRYRDKPRVLWIDSMCINQSDVAERNSQVQQMGRIYENAEKVIIWLGPESEDSDAIMSIMRRQATSTPFPTKYSNIGGPDARYTYGVEAFYNLLQRPWFKRAWCVQEFGLAKCALFQCGQTAVYRDQFIIFYDGVFNDGSLYDRIAEACKKAAISWFDFKRSLSLLFKLLNRPEPDEFPCCPVLFTLVTYSRWEASDSRDKVFAFYSLIPDDDPDKSVLKPDYTLSTTQLYTKVTVHFLQKYRNLDVLSLAALPTCMCCDEARQQLLPSWIPNWQGFLNRKRDYRYRSIAIYSVEDQIMSFDDMYSASLGLIATPIDFEHGYQVLVLNGVHVDTIESIGITDKGFESTLLGELDVMSRVRFKTNSEIMSQWKEIAGLPGESCYQYTNQSLREAFWRTILMDEQLKGRCQRYRIPKDNVELSWFPHFPPSADEDLEARNAIFYELAPMNGRRFFRTAKGLLGLAPAAARKGDCVVVLFGGKVPFIMRNYDGLYHLVGESYVHGIMDGEVIHQPRIEQFKDIKPEAERFRIA
ncbi:heterokaryon incompatibility protein-domain-containing protein [Xylaria curta]|nr:heterokaryon incompatibility protein-domain-containing protein [Xylaria curta]